jgi:hypothetical protein
MWERRTKFCLDKKKRIKKKGMQCSGACFTQLWQVVWEWIWCLWSEYWKSSFLEET